MKRKLLVVDTETAGLDAREHSILSFAAVIYQDGGIAGKFYTLVKEPLFCIENLTDEEKANGIRDAFEVNGIRLTDLLDAPEPWLAAQQFVNWLARNELYGQQTLAGHKVEFDVSFLRRLWRLAGATDFEARFGHRYLCTQSAALLLEQAGRLSLPGGNASLDNVAGALGLVARTPGYHNALDDALLTAQVLKRLIEKLK